MIVNIGRVEEGGRQATYLHELAAAPQGGCNEIAIGALFSNRQRHLGAGSSRNHPFLLVMGLPKNIGKSLGSSRLPTPAMLELNGFAGGVLPFFRRAFLPPIDQ